MSSLFRRFIFGEISLWHVVIVVASTHRIRNISRAFSGIFSRVSNVILDKRTRTFIGIINRKKQAMHYERLTDVPGIRKIKPERFVWHVTSKQNRRSILATGLDAQKSEHKCVCANNQSRNILFFYPFCIDNYHGSLRGNDFLEYDYWRIDTRKVDADWYIDPNMSGGPSEFMGSDRNFVVTETSIPVEALTLFEIDMRFMSVETFHVIESEEEWSLSYFKTAAEIPSDITIVNIGKHSQYELSNVYLEEGDGVMSVVARLPLVKSDFATLNKQLKAA